MKGRLVEIGDERRVHAVAFDFESLERLATHAAQNTFDGHPVAMRVHFVSIRTSSSLRTLYAPRRVAMLTTGKPFAP